LDRKIKIAIFIALLFHVNGLVGMMSQNKPWFVSMTPLTLLIMFGLLSWTEPKISRSSFILACIIFMVGMLVEIIGVNTALLFGHYAYGSAMGHKLYGVPLLMGIQWLVTVVCSAHLLNLILKKCNFSISIMLFSLLAALITTIYDVLIEPVAMQLNYWNWVDHIVPFYNYLCWFLIGFCLHLFYAKFHKIEKPNYYAVALIIIQVAFFILLNVVTSIN
jgi:bisanhydrobacterioruberin hydratase